MSSLINDTLSEVDINESTIDPSVILKEIKISNFNRLVIAHLNINSLRNKFESLKLLIKGNIDILVITESKLDDSFPSQQFIIEGYALPFRLDKSSNSGGVLIYIREDIPCRQLNNHTISDNFEGIFLEINLRKAKWLLFGGYNNKKSNINDLLSSLGRIMDKYMCKFDNLLLLGDFNSTIEEQRMSQFCNIYNLQNLIAGPTCFKNPRNPTAIDVILTNKKRSFKIAK